MKNQEAIQECIKLIESMDVQINYRDDKFLKAAGIEKVKLQNHERAGKKKIKYSFTDIIIKIPEDVRVKLEADYRHRKTKKAIEADKKMLEIIPDAKEQIAKAFVPFIDDVNKVLNVIISENNKNLANLVLSKTSSKTGNRRGLCIVYDDINKADTIWNTMYLDDGTEDLKEDFNQESVPVNGAYQFDTLPDLLDTIARVTVEYCKTLDTQQNVNRQGEAQRGQVTPLFIRQSCAWVCYILLYFGDILSKHFKREPISAQSGVCTQIMHDLHLRTKHTYNYEYFVKEKKLFEYNKWSILPEVILREGNYIAPISPVGYAGHKSGYLGYMIQSLVDQRVFNTYIEPFGGSGVGITQFHKKDGVKYYISDGNYMNMCFYQVLLGSDKIFNEFKTKLKEIQLQVRDIYSRIDEVFPRADKMFGWTSAERRNYQSYFKNMLKIELDEGRKISNLLNEDGFDSSLLRDRDVELFFLNPDDGTYNVRIGDRDFEDRKKDIIAVLGAYFDLHDLYEPMCDLYKYCGKNFCNKEVLEKIEQSTVDLAVMFVALHTSLVNGSVSIPSILSAPKLRNINIDTDFNNLHHAYRNGVTIDSSAYYGANAISILESDAYNKDTTFTYLDSPYINSAGYPIDFEIEHMEELLIACKNFKGDFVFSCRANLPAFKIKDESDFKKDSKSKDTFVVYYDMWLKLKKAFIERGRCCKVLFMKEEKEFDLSKETYMYLLRNNLATAEYRFLAGCIESRNDLEIMITNFDFEVPDYSKFVENSIYGKMLATKENIDGYYVKVDIEDVVKLVKFIYR